MKGVVNSGKSVKVKILLLIATVFLAAGCASLIKGYLNASALVERDSSQALGMFQRIFKSELETKIDDMSLAMELLLQNKAVTTAFAQKNRDELKNLLLTYFNEKLKTKYNIKQFQFHIPPAMSFLRLHQPSKHSDDLSAFRHTVINVNTQKKPVIGLEVGKGELGLRVVYPVESEGNHVGSVEFGGDIDPILSMAADTTNVQYARGGQGDRDHGGGIIPGDAGPRRTLPADR